MTAVSCAQPEPVKPADPPDFVFKRPEHKPTKFWQGRPRDGDSWDDDRRPDDLEERLRVDKQVLPGPGLRQGHALWDLARRKGVRGIILFVVGNTPVYSPEHCPSGNQWADCLPLPPPHTPAKTRSQKCEHARMLLLMCPTSEHAAHPARSWLVVVIGLCSTWSLLLSPRLISQA